MSNIFNTYNQYPIDIVAGHDWHLTDKNGQTYLDFTSGIGVCNFGYSNEQITDNVFLMSFLTITTVMPPWP